MAAKLNNILSFVNIIKRDTSDIMTFERLTSLHRTVTKSLVFLFVVERISPVTVVPMLSLSCALSPLSHLHLQPYILHITSLL